MAFDIHQPIFDDGELLEDAARQYEDDLLRLFAESPEAKAAAETDKAFSPGNWSSLIFDYAFRYIGVTIPDMTAGDLEEILFELFPAKVSTPAETAPEIIAELKAFWQFLHREFGLEHAADCLDMLNEPGIADELREELGNPANYGMAKSIIMQGMERGFDLSSEEGINQWMMTYNQEIINNPPPSLPGFPKMPNFWGMRDEFADSSHSSAKPKQSAKDKKKKRKMRQASQRKNRKKR